MVDRMGNRRSQATLARNFSVQTGLVDISSDFISTAELGKCTVRYDFFYSR